MLRPLLKLTNRIFWAVITTVLLLLALVVSLGRYYMPQLGQYQEQILAELRQRTDLQIEIGGLEGEWRGLSPVVRVKNFELYNPEGEVVVSAGHLAVYFDLIESIYHRMPLAQTISLVNADIELAKSDDGKWGLKGIAAGGAGTASAAAVAFVQQIDLLELTHVNLGTWLPQQGRHGIESISLILRQGLDLSQLTLEVNQGHANTSLRLAADFEGWLDRPQNFRGYLNLDDLQLQPFAPYLGEWYEKLPPSLSGELWLDWREKDGLEAIGTLITSNWQLDKLLEREVPELEALDFDFRFALGKHGAMGGRIQDLGFRWAGIDYRFPEIEFALDSQRHDLALQMSVASIEPMVQGAINSQLLPEALSDVFKTLQPRGLLRNLDMDIPLQKDSLADFRVRANLDGAALESWKGAPGADSIDGYVEAGIDHGRVDLDGSALQLSFPGLYDEPLHFEGVDAQVGWRVGDRVKVNSGQIKLHGDFGKGNAQLDLDIPRQPVEGDFPRMSLLIGVEDSDAKFRNRYIPKFLSKPLLDWLDQSIDGATVDQLGFMYYGALTSPNPLDKTVQLFFDARDGRLKYQPDWPRLEDAGTHFVLADDYLHAEVPQATIMDSTLSNVEVAMQQRNDVAWLEINGDLQGPAGDLIRMLNETPLKDVTGGAFESWNASGDYKAVLGLGIPLKANMQPEVAVDGELSGAQLGNKGLGLSFTSLQGKMRYRNAEGLTAKKLQAQLWGEELLASIGPGAPTSAGNTPMLIEVEGQVAVAGLKDWLHYSAFGLASGKAVAEGTLTIVPSGDDTAHSHLRLSSDMIGVALDLPEPLGKTEADARPLVLDINLAQLGMADLRYAGVLGINADLGTRTGAEPRAGIWLGEDTLPDIPATGVLVGGNLAQVKLYQWLDTLERYNQLAGAQSTSPEPGLAVEQLAIENLEAFGENVANPLVNIGVVDGQWQVSIEHPRITGTIGLPSDDSPFDIRIAQLHMPLDNSAERPEESGEGLASLDPATMPPANVRVEQFSIFDKDMGSWQFALAPEPEGAKVSGLTVKVDGAIFGGMDISEGADLFWSRVDGVHHTQVQGMLRAGNLDDLFSHWGYEAGVTSESAEVIVDFHWQGAPDAIGLTVISGDMYLTVREGQLQQTSGTAAEVLKLVGILNINNLARRLRLDFSDLYKKGLSYDKIQGILLFNRGTLSMVEPLVVTSPSSSMKMTGDFNLVNSEIDVQLVVALPITSNLPWIVALTLPGGIPLAAGVFVAGKVFEKQLQKLTSAVYSVTGTLDHPTIAFKRLTEPSKKKSSAGGDEEAASDSSSSSSTPTTTRRTGRKPR